MRHFIARIDALIAQGTAETLFLAADLPRQVQYALADTLLLGRAERFLGSSWSLMTDLARRLPRDIRVAEMSGRDFSAADLV